MQLIHAAIRFLGASQKCKNSTHNNQSTNQCDQGHGGLLSIYQNLLLSFTARAAQQLFAKSDPNIPMRSGCEAYNPLSLWYKTG
jgi:hypothetical protein